MSDDIAIVGVGIHPFGRTDGVSGRQQGARGPGGARRRRHRVARRAVRLRRQRRRRQRRHAGRRARHDRLPVHQRAQRLRDRRELADHGRPGDPVGRLDLGIAVGFDKHPPGAFNADPAEWGLGHWYGETGSC